jgi:hypothetical protein
MRRVWTAVAAVIALQGFGLSLSAAAAQDARRLCTVVTQDPSEVAYCFANSAGLVGMLQMTSTQTANLAVRHLPNLSCTAAGYNDLGDVVGWMTVTVDEGAAEKCFDTGSGCYEFSPISFVSLYCEQI